VKARTATSLLAAALLLGGCTQATATPAPTAAPAFNGTDLAWIEVNIAMDEQLLPLLTLVRQKGGAVAAAATTAGVRTATETELATLRALHDEAGLPAQNPHEGMPMPGMVTAPDLAQVAKLTGTAFDRAADGKLHEFLEQGLNLARSEAQAGAEPRTLKLAADITASRRKLLD
jgi:hypothetical protein